MRLCGALIFTDFYYTVDYIQIFYVVGNPRRVGANTIRSKSNAQYQIK